MSRITVEKKADSAEIFFSANLVSETVEDLRGTLKKLLSEQLNRITVNFNTVEMIDSMGIGLMVSTHNTLTARGGELVITNLSPDLLELFSVMRLNEFFTIESAK
ncbi:STAS domain-containing protein [Spirochaeta isovalerica]|uniref:Anti-anti-sigma factor n=1 Tax=Spirochaeta isovalerica TaxID=150 RepID=A0A841RBR9_9SPIO|nr:STAS domain-containing protein [Spirochaeta isovalerica]MBB6480677.1 anti-anti-sigma factor [Spirochaeta isovalerica]